MEVSGESRTSVTWHLGPLLRVNPLGTYNRNMREFKRVGLRSKLSPTEEAKPFLAYPEKNPDATTGIMLAWRVMGHWDLVGEQWGQLGLSYGF